MDEDTTDITQFLPQEASEELFAPFPYFGGKRKVSALVWSRLGQVIQYCEPFCGSAAILLGAPRVSPLEVIGDANGFVANFWRSVSMQPEEVLRWADLPVVHVELGVRHQWLLDQRSSIAQGLLDINWPGDARAAGYWLWGQCAWIGSGWADWNRQKPLKGIGQIPHINSAGMGIHCLQANPQQWLQALGQRLKGVRVAHGSWDRCLNTHHAKHNHSSAGFFLDPPYEHFEGLYGAKVPIAKEVEAWCREQGENPWVRIALCGHLGDYDLPGWDVVPWSRRMVTMGSTKTTSSECIWFSPHCIPSSGVLPVRKNRTRK